MPVEDFIIEIYCLISSHVDSLNKEYRIRRRGFKPALSDAEVIAMVIIGEFMGKDTDTAIHRYFLKHWSSWFP